MRASTLVSYCTGNELLDALQTEISAEVEIFRKDLERIGGSAPIHLTEDIDEFELEPKHVKRLCEATISGELASVALLYILTATELSERFKFASEELENVVARLSDTTCGPVTREDIRTEMESLKD